MFGAMQDASQSHLRMTAGSIFENMMRNAYGRREDPALPQPPPPRPEPTQRDKELMRHAYEKQEADQRNNYERQQQEYTSRHTERLSTRRAGHSKAKPPAPAEEDTDPQPGRKQVQFGEAPAPPAKGPPSAKQAP